MKFNKINHIEIPSYIVFAVKLVFSFVQDNIEVLSYILDMEAGELLDKDFLYGILATLYEEETKQLAGWLAFK